MPISSLLELIREVQQAYNSCCIPLCQKFDLSRTAFDILLFLANNPGYDTAKEISRYRGIKANVVSVHVEQLVKTGYLSRRTVPNDRRSVQLNCTEQADPVIAEGRRMQRAFHSALVEGLTETEQELFKHCFQKITENARHCLAVKAE